MLGVRSEVWIHVPDGYSAEAGGMSGFTAQRVTRGTRYQEASTGTGTDW
jgi:hypothetical protein